MQTIEHLAAAYEGVVKAFAIQAGQEIRVIVKPTEVHESQEAALARNLAKKLKEELKYPVKIKVTVQLETDGGSVSESC